VRPVHPELRRLTGLEGWDSFDQPKIVAAVSDHVGRPLQDSEVSAWFTHRALKQVYAEPLAFLRLLGRKALLFWGPAEISNNKILTEHRRASPTLRLGLDFATILALALLGLAHPALRRGPGRDAFLLVLGWIVVYFASYLPFFVAARFRLPLLPLLALLAGCGLHLLFSALADRRWRAFGLVLGAFLALRLLTGVQWVPYEDPAGLYSWRQGLLYQEQGDGPRALESFQRAVTEAPERNDFRLSLAQALTAAGDLPAAEAEYRRLLAEQPESILLRNHLGILLARRGDLPGALALWEEALRLDPDRPTTLTNLAYALATAPPPLGDPERAVELAERALELAPGDGRVLEVVRVVNENRR
jgi:Flp pilus assembly protein TadD